MKDKEKLIVKYLNNSISKQEWNELNLWFEQSKDTKTFNEYIKINYVIEDIMSEFNTEKTKNSVLEKIKKDKRNVITLKFTKFLRYAAAIIIGILATTTYFFKDSIFKFTKLEQTAPVIVNTNVIESGTDKATLTLEDGSVVNLEKGASFQTQNAKSDGEQIIYDAREQGSSAISYNYLTIPRGGQFFIKLSDGTQVWLNSESQLKYPINFKKGETRQVELVYGEAYFEVSPSSEHNGDIFKVFNRSQEIEVIGTEFNIKAYKDETNIYTTLVEGKVNVGIENIKHSLMPDQQLNLDTRTNASIVKTVDVYTEISWKEGIFVFKHKSLKDIMKVLSRWYDINVVFKNQFIENEEFIGSLGRNQNIEEVLIAIKYFGIIKDYQINDKQVILE